MESESDPLTRRAVDLFEKEPLKGNSEVHLHTPTKFGEDRSKDLGGDREQTDRQTNRQTDKRCSIYSMIVPKTSMRYRVYGRNIPRHAMMRTQMQQFLHIIVLFIIKRQILFVILLVQQLYQGTLHPPQDPP